MKRLPITAGKLVAEKYSQDQVILVTVDRQDHRIHVVSYGITKEDCRQADIGARMVEKILKIDEFGKLKT